MRGRALPIDANADQSWLLPDAGTIPQDNGQGKILNPNFGRVVR
jgi:hypothetical protein